MKKKIKANELQKYFVNAGQLAFVKRYRIDDGVGMLMRALEVNNGSGLNFCVLPDRGMDISYASYKGINLSFLTQNAEISPVFYEPEGIGWLRTFNGGLLTTCGLTHFGPAYTGDENYGLHGRYSTIPAKLVNEHSGWYGDDYYIKLSAIVEEGRLFGHKIRLERTISCKYGEPLISIEDTVQNIGAYKSPFMILYHINLGYPLMTENSIIKLNPLESIPRDSEAEKGFERRLAFEQPTENFKEQVFFYRLKSDKNGETKIELQSKDTGLSLKIQFNNDELPYLTEWKMCGIGEYVLGLEPCNCPCMNREELIKKNLIPYLASGESRKMKLQIKIEEMR